MEHFERTIIDWFQHHQRDLPWRKTQNPYAIWVSEIMLQQTQVIRMIEYYERFLTMFPTIADLAQAEQAQLLKAWEGLGYYSRVRNMQKAAQLIMSEHNGVFPHTYEHILALPGIGTYTAGAISACAFNQPKPAVDGNVLRVMSRFAADFQDISKPATKQFWEQKLANIVTLANPSAFNQGLIEIGALVCTPTNPQCPHCPLQSQCQAVVQDIQDQLPVKARKKPAQTYYYETFLVTDGQHIHIVEQTQKGVLQHLWALPQVKVADHAFEQYDIQNLLLKRGYQFTQVNEWGRVKHIFSHQIWQMRVWVVTLKEGQAKEPFVDEMLFQQYPMANSHRKIVTAFWEQARADVSLVADAKQQYETRT